MARRAKAQDAETVEWSESAPGDPPGLLVLLDGTGGNLHAVGSRLGEIANIIGAAIGEAEGDTKISLQALLSLL